MASVKDVGTTKNNSDKIPSGKSQREIDGIDKMLKPNDLNFDIEELEEWTESMVDGMMADREAWHGRRKKYMPEFENLLRDNRIDGPWENSADFHVPMTMWMMKQMHARIYAALFGDGYGFVTVPQEKMDVARAKEVDQTMRWAITSYANEWEGIGLVMDDWIWDVCKEGWGVLKLAWDKRYQKMALTPDELEQFNKNASIEQVLNGMIQLVKTWDGPRIITLDHESVLFPGRARNSSDLNEPPLVAHLMEFSNEDIKARVQDGLWLRKPSEQILKGKQNNTTTGNRQVDDARRLQDAAQGVQSMGTQTPTMVNPVYECFARVDIDHDAIEEDLVYYWSPITKKITRITTLDRVNVSMKRPLHKVDFIRRPRRTYGIGMPELLYSMNKEADAMHNQRVDFGTLASIPTFFFRPLSGMKGEKIRLRPGEGIPIANPHQDVFIPNFNNNVQFTRAEEQMVVGYAERVAALPAITGGQSPTPAGPSSTATGMTTLIAQTGFDFDVVLNRFKCGYENVIKNLHSLMMVRMPAGYSFRVLGAGNTQILDDAGMPVVNSTMTRQKLYGSFDFKIRANDRALNREVMKQDALVLGNVLMNPILIQAGIIQPDNLYNIANNILSSRGELDGDLFITNPQAAEKPLSVLNEIVMLTQGQMPRIILSDDHQAKIAALEMFMQSPQFANDVGQGIVPQNAPENFRKAIAKHEQLNAAVMAQANQANVTGQQVGTSLGARMSGDINQQTGRSVAANQVVQAEEAAMPSTAGGLEIPTFS